VTRALGEPVDDRIGRELVALLPRLRRFAWGLAGSLEEGDDLVQSACARALGRQDQYREGTRLDSWMFRIIQTIWIDDRRSARVRREEAMDPADLEPLAAGDAALELEHRLALAGVRRHVARLPPEQRAVLLLVCVEGLSYKAAAETLGIPVGTVMSRLSRARLALARMLGSGSSGEGGALVNGGAG
jgi:RNA polymerase sigma-70 factor (ECF subfamily)